MIHRRFMALLVAAVLAAPLAAGVAASEADAAFDQSIRPLLNTYCQKCHSTDKHKGDLDLQRFTSLSIATKQPKVWQGVAEQLALNEMPPPKEPQPTATEKERLANWVRSTLDSIALAHAGDPGPVVLRRLSNAEYTYTIRDLTGVESLDPVREFPVDGAAGEGFTNTGQALVMSPALLAKYLDAAKDVANHAMLLPDGIRFSAKTSRRDRTEELLAEIRAFYRDFTDPGGGAKVNLQGVVFETNAGGRLPLEKYLTATIAERDALINGKKTTDALARERGLNAKYLATLYKTLTDKTPSLILDPIRDLWHNAKPNDSAALGALAAEIAEWQKALWKFSSVGHIGKLNGPKAWMEPVSPLEAKHDVKLKMPDGKDAKDVTLYLVASSASGESTNDFVVWQEPKLVAPGRPPLLLKDVRDVCRRQAERRKQLFGSAIKILATAAEATPQTGKAEIGALAQKHGVDAEALSAWLDFLGIGSGGSVSIDGLFTTPIKDSSGHDFINGWGKSDTPLIVANSSDTAVNIPGNMKPHGVAVHPSPKLQAAVGWRSPIAGFVSIESVVSRAHTACGNGIIWFLELRHGTTRRRLASGTITDNKPAKAGPFEKVEIQPGDVISILIDPRDGNHSCDLTAVDLVINSAGDAKQTWNLAADVSPDILAGNPHADRLGNKAVWYFYTEPIGSGEHAGPLIPADSLLARWRSAQNPEEKSKLAQAVQELLASNGPAKANSPDGQLFNQLNAFADRMLAGKRATPAKANGGGNDTAVATWGVDPALFGHHPNGEARDAASLCVHAPSVIEIHLPAELAAGCEFVTTGSLDKQTGAEGCVQLQVLTEKPAASPKLLPAGTTATQAGGLWSSNNQRIAFAAPILANDGSAARQRIEANFDTFRRTFPAALCYAKIVPVDEVVTLTLYHREDNQLADLMLDDAQKSKLNRLWDELHFVSHDALALVDAYEQLWQFATQDADPKAFEPLREPIKQRAAAFRKTLLDAEPKHVDAVLELANRAYRRPLADAEKNELRALYKKLRDQELSHDDAIRLTLARVLVAPAFLYRSEKPVAGKDPGAISDFELANRLSYFLWSSMPDAELRAAAVSGKLHEPAILSAQTKRMLTDSRTRRLATEFGCSWLHIHGFDELGEKSERHFPTFNTMRGAMYEESILFFADLFQNDRPVLNLLDSDYTFLNDALAKHYGIPGVTGAEFRRIDGIKKYARGGILAQATTLSKQSGASRTSPILRGNWVAEALLGDKLPRPPKDVPPLPEDEATEKLTVRQLTEKHSTDPRCATCHKRIDAFGFSLEAFDAIGRKRDHDLGNRVIDTRVKTMDGAEFEGVDGLRNYLLTTKRDVFLHQFCRKLLGYALGRAVQLSDEPLLKEMLADLKAHDYRVGVVIDKIVQCSQFRNIRGRDAVDDE